VPLFDKVEFDLGEKTFTILKKNSGKKIKRITYNNRKVDSYFISYDELKKGKTLVVETE
jgi:putative alpha-1,2-mannosidase